MDTAKRLAQFGICFHSSDFPSEWGVDYGQLGGARFNTVSIQVISPASGEFLIAVCRLIKYSSRHG